MKFSSLLFLALLLLFGPKSQATHIVGGVISYECLGFNSSTQMMSIRLTLKVYRDAINGQAGFDNPASLGIFRGSNNLLYQNLSLSSPVITTAPIDLSNPCLSVSPGSVEVEEGVYTTTINLPYDADGYYISYQRCCRNNTINNLVQPGSVGATYSIFLSGSAMLSCNSSPVFNNYPPIVICANQPLVFDHAATDQDGHTLRYSLCTPSTGASSLDPAPSPPAAPPYVNVPFSAGLSATNPMPANPALSIDPNTGLLTGTPTQIGQYVVGVCVSEFDANGNLLSTTLRDFQFNVEPCFSNLNAAIFADSVSANGQGFLLNQCDDNTFRFTNQSTASPQGLITAYEWYFDLNNGTAATSSFNNPTIVFPGPDVYNGWLVANPGQVGCTDTAYITVEVYPPIFPNWGVVIDSCNPTVPPLQFIDSTTIGGLGTIVAWDWDFGDGSSSNQQNPNHIFPNAGQYQVNLVVTDSNGCEDQIGFPVDWYPPAIPQFTVDDPNGCEPHYATFTHSSFPFTSSYQTIWDFGDGDSSNLSPTVGHAYPNPGQYDVSLTHVSPWGCVSQDLQPQLIEVYEGPTAAYNYTYDSCEYAAVDFFDASSPNSQGDAIVSWNWDFMDGTLETTQNSSHLYALAGSYPVQLAITDINGCTDTISDSIQWYPKPVIDVSLTDNSGCRPSIISFINNSYPINGYSTIWDFGDGASDTAASPSHIYTQAGVYPIELVITSPLGCTDSFLDTVSIFELPTAQFSSSFDPCVIGAVSFDEQAQSNPAGTPLQFWQWDFDDGTILSAQDTSHLYNLAGDFEVQLIVEDTNSCRDTVVQTVAWHPAPIVAVDVSDSVGCEPLNVDFINNSYPINGYSTQWNFGDGGSDTAASPSYIYQQPGEYLVHLYILSPTGCTGDFYDTILVHENPNAQFSYSFDSCEYTGVFFSQESTANLAGDSLILWDWDFGNGETAVLSAHQDTVINYPPRDSYYIQLIIEDVNACRDTSIQLMPYYPAPVFPVNSHSTEACVPVAVNFDNNILNDYPGYSFLWSFGDGNSTTAFDSNYVYENGGTYYASLLVRTASGCEQTFYDTIQANGLPEARFDSRYDACEIGAMRFRNLSVPSNEGILTQSFWSFGDGNSSTDPLVDHFYNYPDTGYYLIQLEIEDENGCQDQTTDSVYWRPLPIFPVDLRPLRLCGPSTVPLPEGYPYPIEGYSYSWDLGDGRRSNAAQPDLSYSSFGSYPLSLQVNSAAGCVDSFSAQIDILEEPVAGFSFAAVNAGEISFQNPEVQFTDQSMRANLWSWDFGDGQQVLQQNPIHNYADTGLYLVQQVVYHRNGCPDTAQAVVDISPQITYFLPNAFTPNDDGKNDGYRGEGYLDFIEQFDMRIYNRWGEEVFRTTDPRAEWNGRIQNNGRKCQAGLYVVQVQISGARGFRKEIKGFATIVY